MQGKKSITIIGEGETEWFYFDSLRIARRLPFKLSPEMPSHPDIASMMKTAERCLEQEYDHVVCVVDMDRFHQFPADMQRYRQLRASRKFAKVEFIETDPCTEFWFLLHFLPGLSRRRIDLYRYLTEHGDLERAKANAKILSEYSKQNPQDRIAFSEIYKVFSLLDEMSK